jgi:hypothetical protein
LCQLAAHLDVAHDQDRLSVRWNLGYGLGLEVFRRFFEHVVGLCQDAGLVWGKEVLADATRVSGNAAVGSLVPRLREVVDDHLVALIAGDAAADHGDDAARDGPGGRNLLEACRLDPHRPPSGPFGRLSTLKISRTDPDVAAMSMRDGHIVLGYQDHNLVDSGKARIIFHCLVTPGDVAENHVLLDQFRRTLCRRKIRPERLVADARYATRENTRALEEQPVRAYMPLPEWDKSSPCYHRAAFTYDYDSPHDVYRCPQGQTLKREWIDDAGERAIYRARAANCNSCPVKSECTRSNQGPGRPLLSRRLSRPRLWLSWNDRL